MDIFSLAGKITVNYGDAVKGIDEVSSKAQNLASSLGKTMQDAGQKITSVGDKISSAGKSLAPVSVAVGGVATAALKTSMDFDSAMSKVKAISGATGDDFQALRDKAIEMGRKTKFSVSEAAEAFSYMAMAGWKTEDMLSGIEGIMNLAAASGKIWQLLLILLRMLLRHLVCLLPIPDILQISLQPPPLVQIQMYTRWVKHLSMPPLLWVLLGIVQKIHRLLSD